MASDWEEANLNTLAGDEEVDTQGQATIGDGGQCVFLPKQSFVKFFNSNENARQYWIR